MQTFFVLGNGPSLADTPWRELHKASKRADVFTIGINRIHLIYPTVSWRPDYWVIADRSKSTHSGADVQLHLEQGYPCYVRSDIPRGNEDRDWSDDFGSDYRPFPECCHIDVDHNATDHWHLDRPDKFCKMGGSLFVAVQLAAQEGAERIVLLGCDGNLQPNSNNHFVEGYVSIDAHGVQSALLANRNLAFCHQIMEKECEERGIVYQNATPSSAFGGERVDLHEALLALVQ